MNRRLSESEINNIKTRAEATVLPHLDDCTTIVDLCDQLLEEGPIETKFTEEEKQAIKLSADLWNAFISLPEQHPSDKIDFCNSIHTIQRILGWRPMMRKGTLDV